MQPERPPPSDTSMYAKRDSSCDDSVEVNQMILSRLISTLRPGLITTKVYHHDNVRGGFSSIKFRGWTSVGEAEAVSQDEQDEQCRKRQR